MSTQTEAHHLHQTPNPTKNLSVRTFRDLVAWQRAYALALRAYHVTNLFPIHERFGLTSQIQRSSLSIACNIAEGYGRGTTADYSRFLKIARGSLYEVDTQLMFAYDMQYLTKDDYETIKQMLDECERVLAGLIRSIELNRQHRSNFPSSSSSEP